jgi:hypothetical protein
MKIPNFANLCLAALCLAFSTPALAQTAGAEPPSRDDVILYLRTMRSHDMLQKTMEVQAQSMRNLFRSMSKENGSQPPDFDAHFKKAMADMIKGMPTDEILQAMIPAYQDHFTKSDLEAMSAFYSSPVGQKVLEELPAVLQEGNQAAMPILSKYLNQWKDRMAEEFKVPEKIPATTQKTPSAQN